jgi:hypothetical protein
VARETVAAKAVRYLAESRLTVERVDVDGLVVARCRGGGGEYHLGWDPSVRQWRCTCLERKGECSHLKALRMVVIR